MGTTLMKIRILKRPGGCFSFDSGPLKKWSDVDIGTVMNVPDGAAQDLIVGGYAEKVLLARVKTPRA